MTLVKRNPNLMPDLPRFFDDFFTKDLFDWGFKNYSGTNTTLPAVNIKETNDDYRVEMASSGLTKKDFTIELDNEMLKISSTVKNENELKEGESFTRKEFSYQSFQRVIHLPKQVVDEQKIKASYQDGILRIMIPKKEEAKKLPARVIKVQ